MRRIRAAVLAVLAVMLLTASGQVEPTRAGQCDGIWFWSEQTGKLLGADFEKDRQCRWGTAEDTNAIQRSGACGLAKQANDRIFLTHNWLCGGLWCPQGEGRESNIPLLKAGDRVQLCDYGWLHEGVVTENIYVKDGKIKPQTNFPCKGTICGTIVTSVGPRQWWWGPADYVVVRIRY